jgi:cupin 2 domain-containing protein
MAGFRRGLLSGPERAPRTGETTRVLAAVDGASVEHVLSGTLDRPVDYRQDHDEWVVLLAGGAELEIDGAKVPLSAGEWLLLPRGLPHRLLSVAPGSSWLAVRGPSPGPSDG